MNSAVFSGVKPMGVCANVWELDGACAFYSTQVYMRMCLYLWWWRLEDVILNHWYNTDSVLSCLVFISFSFLLNKAAQKSISGPEVCKKSLCCWCLCVLNANGDIKSLGNGPNLPVNVIKPVRKINFDFNFKFAAKHA